MVGNSVLALSMLGIALAAIDGLLPKAFKALLNERVVALSKFLTRVRKGGVVTWLKCPWIYASTFILPVKILVADAVYNQRIDQLIYAGFAILIAVPSLWILSHASNIRAVVLSAALVALACYMYVEAIGDVVELVFVKGSRDTVVMTMHRVLLSFLAFGVAPILLAYFLSALLVLFEFVFCGLVQHNRSQFVALCILMGAVASLYKTLRQG